MALGGAELAQGALLGTAAADGGANRVEDDDLETVRYRAGPSCSARCRAMMTRWISLVPS